MKYYFVLLLALIIVAVIAGCQAKDKKQPEKEITTFWECVEAGNPIMETDPETCRANGKIFTNTDNKRFIETEPDEADMKEDTSAEFTSEKGTGTIYIDDTTVVTNAKSPFVLSGRIPGTWFFEGSLLAEIVVNNQVISSTNIYAEGDWMTTELVPFATTFEFPEQEQGSQGALRINKENASDDPSLNDSIEIVITF